MTPRPILSKQTIVTRLPRRPAATFPRQGRRGLFRPPALLRDLGIETWRDVSLIAFDTAALLLILTGVCFGFALLAACLEVL